MLNLKYRLGFSFGNGVEKNQKIASQYKIYTIILEGQYKKHHVYNNYYKVVTITILEEREKLYYILFSKILFHFSTLGFEPLTVRELT